MPPRHHLPYGRVSLLESLPHPTPYDRPCTHTEVHAPHYWVGFGRPWYCLGPGRIEDVEQR